MPKHKTINTLAGVVLTDVDLSFADLCQAMHLPAEAMLEMIDAGVVQPTKGRTPHTWQFAPQALKRLRAALNLHHHFNRWEVLAVALDLLDETKQARQQIVFYEHYFSIQKSRS